MEVLIIDKTSREIIYQAKTIEQNMLTSILVSEYLIINKKAFLNIKEERVLDFDSGILTIICEYFDDF